MDLAVMQPEETIFYIGDEGENFYFIIEGTVEILKPDQQLVEEFKSISNNIEYKKSRISSLKSNQRKCNVVLNKLIKQTTPIHRKNSIFKVEDVILQTL